MSDYQQIIPAEYGWVLVTFDAGEGEAEVTGQYPIVGWGYRKKHNAEGNAIDPIGVLGALTLHLDYKEKLGSYLRTPAGTVVSEFGDADAGDEAQYLRRVSERLARNEELEARLRAQRPDALPNGFRVNHMPDGQVHLVCTAGDIYQSVGTFPSLGDAIACARSFPGVGTVPQAAAQHPAANTPAPTSA